MEMIKKQYVDSKISTSLVNNRSPSSKGKEEFLSFVPLAARSRPDKLFAAVIIELIRFRLRERGRAL